MKSARAGVGVFGIALCLAVLLGLYQNCAPNTSSGSYRPDDADQTVRALAPAAAPEETASIENAQGPLRAITAKSAEPSTNPERDCVVQNLRCFKKVYSPLVDDATGDETLCLDASDPSTCVLVKVNKYNTGVSLATCPDCGPDAADPGGEYNREEHTCWVGEPGAFATRHFALRSTFNEAARAALESCGAR